MSGSRTNHSKKPIIARIGPLDRNDENMTTNVQDTAPSQSSHSRSTQLPLFNPGIPPHFGSIPMRSGTTTTYPPSTTTNSLPGATSTSYSGRTARQYRSKRSTIPHGSLPLRRNVSATSSSSSGNPQLSRPYTRTFRAGLQSANIVPPSYNNTGTGGDHHDTDPLSRRVPFHSLHDSPHQHAFSTPSHVQPMSLPPVPPIIPRTRSNEPLLTRAASSPSTSSHIPMDGNHNKSNNNNRMMTGHRPLFRPPIPLDRSQSAFGPISSTSMHSHSTPHFTVPSISSTSHHTGTVPHDMHSVNSQGTTGATTQFGNLHLPQQQSGSNPNALSMGFNGGGSGMMSSFESFDGDHQMVSHDHRQPSNSQQTSLHDPATISIPDSSTNTNVLHHNANNNNVMTDITQSPMAMHRNTGNRSSPTTTDFNINDNQYVVPELVESPPESMKRRLQSLQRRHPKRRLIRSLTRTQSSTSQSSQSDDDDDEQMRDEGGTDTNDSSEERPILSPQTKSSGHSHCYNTRGSANRRRSKSTDLPHPQRDERRTGSGSQNIPGFRHSQSARTLINTNSRSPNSYEGTVKGCGLTFNNVSDVNRVAVQDILTTFCDGHHFGENAFAIPCEHCGGERWGDGKYGYNTSDLKQHLKEWHRMSPDKIPSEYSKYGMFDHKCIVDRKCHSTRTPWRYQDLVSHLMERHQMEKGNAVKIANIWRFKYLGPSGSRFEFDQLWRAFYARRLSAQSTTLRLRLDQIDSNRSASTSGGGSPRKSTSPQNTCSSVNTPPSLRPGISSSSQTPNHHHHYGASTTTTTDSFSREQYRAAILKAMEIDQWSSRGLRGSGDRGSAVFKVKDCLFMGCTNRGSDLPKEMLQKLEIPPFGGDGRGRGTNSNRRVPSNQHPLDRASRALNEIRIQPTTMRSRMSPI